MGLVHAWIVCGWMALLGAPGGAGGAVLPVLPGTVDTNFFAALNPFAIGFDVAVDGYGRIVLGGEFSTVHDTNRHRLARLTSDGGLDATFDPGTGADNVVLAVAPLAGGKILIGGAFNFYNGTNRSHLARLEENGALDLTFDPRAGTNQFINGIVRAVVALTNGQVLIGGDFTRVGGSNATYLARLNADGSFDPTFEVSIAGSFPLYVRAIQVDGNGRILVGGGFGIVNGMARQNVARLNSDGTVDASFNPGSGANGYVTSFGLQADGRILVGGSFSGFNGIARNGVVRLSAGGAVDISFTPPLLPGSAINALAVQPDGKVVAGGGFYQIGDEQRGGIARLQANGSLDLLFAPMPGANGWVEDVELLPNGKILITGNFATVDGLNRTGLARLQGGEAPVFAPVFAIQPTSQVVHAGVNVTFTTRAFGNPVPTLQWYFNSAPIPGATGRSITLPNVHSTNAGLYTVIASNVESATTSEGAVLTVIPPVTAPGRVDIDFYSGAGVIGYVKPMAVQPDGRIVIGGNFFDVDDGVRLNVARLTAEGRLDSTFDAGSGPNSVVTTVLVQPDGKILIGGWFVFVNGFGRGGVARLLSDGTVDSTFAPVPSNQYDAVASLALQSNGMVLVGRDLFGAPRPLLSRLDTNGLPDLAFNVGAGPNSDVEALAVLGDGRILVAGAFTEFDGLPANRLLRLHPDGSLDSTFNTGSGPSGRIAALAVAGDGKIVLAGDFRKINGVTRLRLARLHPDGGLDAGFDAGTIALDDTVLSLAVQTDGKVIFGTDYEDGTFSVARLNPDGSLDDTFKMSRAGSALGLALLSDGKVLLGGDHAFVSTGDFSTGPSIPRPGIARLFGGEVASFAPVLRSSPEGRAVAAGSDVTLEVLANGVPAPAYQWQFNGADLPGATGWRLTLHNVRGFSAGAYTVRVSNVLGAAVSPVAVLSVLPALVNAGAPDITFYTGSGPNDRVNAVAAQNDGRIVIGGAFTEVNGVGRNRVARLLPDGSLDSTFDPGQGANHVVHALDLDGNGAILIGGEFTSINGATRRRVARLTSTGAVDGAFDPGAGPNGAVFAIAAADGNKVLIGGAFTNVNGVARGGVARLDSSGGVDAAFVPVPGANGPVLALVEHGAGLVTIAGAFSAVDGLMHSRVARLLASGAVDAGFGSMNGFDGGAAALAVDNSGNAILGGEFRNFGAQSVSRVVRLTSGGLLDGAFNAPFPSNFLSSVFALALQSDGKVVMGGDFQNLDFAVRGGIARLGTNGVLDASFDPGSGVSGGSSFFTEYGTVVDLTRVSAIAFQPNGDIVIGGDFMQVNGLARPHVARLFGQIPLSAVRIRAVSVGGGIQAELHWDTGILQTAEQITGPWADVPGNASPYSTAPTNTQRFFRLRLR